MLLFLFQPAGAPGAQVVHTQQRAAASAAPAEVVTIPTGSGVRAVTPASTAGSTTLSPGQSQTRPLTSQVTTGSEMNTGFSLTRHPLQPITVSQIGFICCLPSNHRYNVTKDHRGPTAVTATATAAAATTAAGYFPTDQSCRQNAGTPPALYALATESNSSVDEI